MYLRFFRDVYFVVYSLSVVCWFGNEGVDALAVCRELSLLGDEYSLFITRAV
jgi:hypothetical protein